MSVLYTYYVRTRYVCTMYICLYYVCTTYVCMFVCKYVNGPCEQSRNNWARGKPVLANLYVTPTAIERFNQLVL